MWQEVAGEAAPLVSSKHTTAFWPRDWGSSAPQDLVWSPPSLTWPKKSHSGLQGAGSLPQLMKSHSADCKQTKEGRGQGLEPAHQPCSLVTSGKMI